MSSGHRSIIDSQPGLLYPPTGDSLMGAASPLRPAPRLQGYGSAHRRPVNVAILIAILALHGVVLLLLLTAPGFHDRIVQRQAMNLFDVEQPPVPPPVPPSVPPPPLANPHAARSGGGAPPSPRAAALPPPRVDITPVSVAVPLLPSAPVIAPSTGADPRPGLANGTAGAGAGNAGPGDGSGPGSGPGSGNGEDAGAGSSDVLLPAKWVVQPTDADLRPFNPLQVDFVRRTGATRIACQVQLDYHVHNCRVLIEKPGSLGLGKAALKASPMFRVYPPVRDGKPVADGWVGIVIYFHN